MDSHLESAITEIITRNINGFAVPVFNLSGNAYLSRVITYCGSNDKMLSSLKVVGILGCFVCFVFVVVAWAETIA